MTSGEDLGVKGSFSLLIMGKKYINHFQSPAKAAFIHNKLCIKGVSSKVLLLKRSDDEKFTIYEQPLDHSAQGLECLVSEACPFYNTCMIGVRIRGKNNQLRFPPTFQFTFAD